MIIGGLDIASYKTGYFFLDIVNIKYKIGLIEAKGNDVFDRLRQINRQSKKLLNAYDPEILIVESTFLDEKRKHKTTKKRGSINTLKTLEKVHGVILGNTKEYVDIKYMTPGEHKETLTGLGHAQKKMTIWAIQKKLGLVGIDDNMADAAALVFTHLIKNNQWDILEKIKENYEN